MATNLSFLFQIGILIAGIALVATFVAIKLAESDEESITTSVTPTTSVSASTSPTVSVSVTA